MTRKEAAGVIKFEKACVLRQDTPRCNRDCKKCDLLLPTEDVLTAYDMAIKALEQEPKTGHWIYEKRKRLINETDEDVEYVTDYWCKCSKCGGDFGYIKMKDAFCKYCGAKMIEPQERSDKE